MRSSYDIFSAVHLEHISSEPVCGGAAQCGDGAGDIFGQRETTAGITLACGFEDFLARIPGAGIGEDNVVQKRSVDQWGYLGSLPFPGHIGR
jgi:hypothetical protein